MYLCLYTERSCFMKRFIPNVITNWVLSFILLLGFVITLISFSSYSWLDDLLIENYTRGLFSTHGFVSYDQLIFLSNGLVHLGKLMPGVSWYFIFLQVSLLSFFILCATILKTKFETKTLFHKALFSIFFIFSLEYLFLVSFTSNSIILSGLSLILLYNYHQSNTRWQNGLLLFFCCLGFLIRQNSSVAIMLAVSIFFFTAELFSSKKDFKKYLYAGFIICFAVCSVALHKVNAGSENFEYQAFSNPYVFNLLDGFNYSIDQNKMSKEALAKFNAFAHWYYCDEAQYNQDYLESLGGDSPFTLSTLNKAKSNIWEEWSKLQTRSEVNNGIVRQSQVFIFYVIILTLYFLVFLWLTIIKGFRDFPFFAGVVCLLFTFMLFIVSTIFIKFETRVFAPFSFVILTLLTLVLSDAKSSKGWLKILVFFLICAATLRFTSLIDSIRLKVLERNQKEIFLKSFSKQKEASIVLLDLYSMSLFGSGPYHKLPELNFRLTSFGEHPFHLIKEHRDFIKQEICGYNTFPDFFECVLERGDVLWIMPDFRAKILEDYYALVYNKHYKFELTTNQYAIEQVQYSFLWDSANFGIYKLTTY